MKQQNHLVKEMDFVFPTKINGETVDVHCTVQALELGEIADIIVKTEDKSMANKLSTAVYHQHADKIIECMNELF